MKRIFMSMEEIETPELLDGEVVEAIRLGGPRDGGTIGYFKVKRARDGDGLTLEPVDATRLGVE